MKRRYLTYVLSLLSFCLFLPLYVLADNGQVRIFYAEQYGLVGDGLTNNLSAFHKLANVLNANGGGRIVFPKGKVFVVKFTDDCNGGYAKYPVPDAMALDITNCKDVTIDLNGSSIKVFPNHSTKYCVIRFFNCQNFVVKNGALIGDAVKHDYSSVMLRGKEYKTTHEWGYGICNAGSQGIVDKMNISYMTGDGLYVGSVSLNKKAYHAMTTIDGCEISYCRRNGITAASSQSLYIRNTKVHHIGTYGNIIGTAPMAGLDLEYEDGVNDYGDVSLDSCQFMDCTRWGIVTSNASVPKPKNFWLKNSVFTRATLHLNNMPKNKTKLVADCVLNNATVFVGDADVVRCKFNMGNQINYISKTNFDDCDFIGTGSVENGSQLNGFSMEKTIFHNCRFSNILGNEKKGVIYQGFSGYLYPMDAYFTECTFTNTSFCIGGKKNDSKLYFDGCQFRKGCKLRNLNKSPISFKNSSLTDVGFNATQRGLFSFDHCSIIQNNKTVKEPSILY